MSYQQISGIKSWAEEDRPREKMLLKGKSALSDAELIAILLGSGTREMTAVELARQLLARAGNNLIQLGQLSIEQLMQFKGIGEAKAITLAAALELGRRRQKADAHERFCIRSSSSAYELLAPLMADLPHEEFWVVCLNRKNDVLSYQKVTSGGITGTVVDPRMMFGAAFAEKSCTAIIMAHNHPSGAVQPSEADKKLTKKMVEAGDLLDISVIDHMIITDRGYYSFRDNDLLV
jgi:DNA repair protein RadC